MQPCLPTLAAGRGVNELPLEKKVCPVPTASAGHRDRDKDATSRAESDQALQKEVCCSDWQLQFPWLSFHPEVKTTCIQSELNQF